MKKILMLLGILMLFPMVFAGTLTTDAFDNLVYNSVGVCLVNGTTFTGAVAISSNLSVTGNISTTKYFGDGSSLTGIPTSALVSGVASNVSALQTSNTTTNSRIDSVNTTVAALQTSNTTTNGLISALQTSNTTTNSRIDSLNSTKANLASPTFTGTVTVPSPFTVGATSVTTSGTQLNYLNAATGTTGTTSSSVVFSASPTLTGQTIVTNLAANGNITVGWDSGNRIGMQFSDGSAYRNGFAFDIATRTTIVEALTSGSDSEITFRTGNVSNPSEKMRIDYNGYVGINTTNPTNMLHIKNDGTTAGLYIDQNGAGYSIDVAHDGASNAVRITKGTSAVGHGLYLNSAFARTDGNYYLASIEDTSASTAANTMRVDNYGTGANLVLTHRAATGYGLSVTSSTNAYTDANGLVKLTLANSADTGRLLYMPIASTTLSNEAVLISKSGTGGGNVMKIFNDGTGSSLYLDQNGNATALVVDSIATSPAMRIVPMAAAPVACTIGDIYADTSGAYCFCSATNTWSNTIATGTCA